MDKAERTDGTLSRSDFAFDPERNLYVCPGGKELKKYHRAFAKPRDGLTKDGTMIYFARKQDCEACAVSCRVAHLKRILRLGRLRLRAQPNRSQRRVPIGRHRPKSAEAGEA